MAPSFDCSTSCANPRRVFLNDLQGPPSACGCGHPLCRWTTDYGPLTSASRLTNGAAAGFVAAVKHLAPGVEVIPVWATECEEHDKDGLCAGVGCFRGTCWREWTAQLTPLAAEAHTVAALLLSGEFQRDLPGNDPRAVWIARALAYFQEMPARYKADGIPRNRLIAVLQGWNVTEDQLNAQMALADESGAMGVVVAYGRIEQSWEPRMHRLSGNRAGARGNEGPADSPSKK